MREILPIGSMIVIEEKRVDDGNAFSVEGMFKTGIVKAVSDEVRDQTGISDNDEIIYVSGKAHTIGLGFDGLQALNVEDVLGMVYVEKRN